MIFATVGTQLPFDRLVRSLDGWCACNPAEVRAQIGSGAYLPRHFGWEANLAPQVFRSLLEDCETVVAHAGMGTIISALELGKRVIVMPRRASLGEHRNEHQLATVERLRHLSGLEIVHDGEQLAAALSSRTRSAGGHLPSGPHPELIETIRRFAGLEAA